MNQSKFDHTFKEMVSWIFRRRPPEVIIITAIIPMLIPILVGVVTVRLHIKWRFRFHFSKWKVENYDRGLSDRVMFGRHAISIDEKRANFPKVGWGFKNSNYERPGQPFGLKQIWFAGNHSDIGGSYPEAESRLSDVALNWMLEQAQEVEHPLIIDCDSLNLFPQIDGMQHDEIQSVKDKYPSWWPHALRMSWGAKPRRVNGLLHPSVAQRFACSGVLQAGNFTCYRPSNLKKHPDFAIYYQDS